MADTIADTAKSIPSTLQEQETTDLFNKLAPRLPLRTAEIRIGGSIWQITAARDREALRTIAHEVEHLPHGFLLWESAIALARWLMERADGIRGKRLLELGAGIGLPGLVASRLGAEVWQTDHQPGALALAAYNAQQNQLPDVRRFVADWRDWQHAPRYNLIIGADILYEWNLHFYLERIFHKSLAPGGRLIFADPGRAPALEFVTQLEGRGWQIDLETLPVEALAEPGVMVEVAIMICRRG